VAAVTCQRSCCIHLQVGSLDTQELRLLVLLCSRVTRKSLVSDWLASLGLLMPGNICLVRVALAHAMFVLLGSQLA
jgi:hypothetical protein